MEKYLDYPTSYNVTPVSSLLKGKGAFKCVSDSDKLFSFTDEIDFLLIESKILLLEICHHIVYVNTTRYTIFSLIFLSL